ANNSYSYFTDAMTDYRQSTFPYHQAGIVLKGFVDSTGAPGNAFMVAYDYWWDHRSLALESGDRYWNNGLLHDHLQQRILEMMRANMQRQPRRPFIYQLHPDRQLLFFVKPGDTESINTLQSMFPNGELIEHQTFDPDRNFLTYVAPPVGCDWMLQNMGSVPNSCSNDSGTQAIPNSQ